MATRQLAPEKGSSPMSKAGLAIMVPIAWHRADSNMTVKPIHNGPLSDSSLCTGPWRLPKKIAVITPVEMTRMPNNFNRLNEDPRAIQLSTSVIGAAVEKMTDPKRGPRRACPANSKVSPRKTPNRPDSPMKIKASVVQLLQSPKTKARSSIGPKTSR